MSLRNQSINQSINHGALIKGAR